jgi:tRNA threonylcarbamoyladenosine biosynthesis protein TsaB
MQQVYWGAYVRNAQGIMQLQGVEGVFAPMAIPVPEGQGWHGAGPGWDAYPVLLQQRLGSRLADWQQHCLPRARHIAVLGVAGWRAGQSMAAEAALPIYIRDDVAVKHTPP